MRIQFIIGRAKGKTPFVPRAELERQITAITRIWIDRLEALSEDGIDQEFPLAYQEHVSPEAALGDIDLLNSLENDQQIALDFHGADADGRIGLKLFHQASAIPLSRRVPMLENLGFNVIQERTFRIETADGTKSFIHDMVLENARGGKIDLNQAEPKLKSAIQAIWSGDNDNDNFNTLVLVAGLDWQMASVMRAFARYLRQIRSRFTVHSMARKLAAHADISRDLAQLFAFRFDPKTKSRDAKENAKRDDIIQALEKVSSSDDDSILRDFLNMMAATLRTNFYSPVLEMAGTETAPTPVLAFKIDPSAVNIIPQPVPTLSRNFCLRAAGRGAASALWSGGTRWFALVGSGTGLPHRGVGSGEGPAGEECGDRTGWLQGRLRAEETAERRRSQCMVRGRQDRV